MEVKGGTAEAGTNVHQWGNGIQTRNKWKLVDKGNGCYCIISAVGGGNSLALDVLNGSKNNGTNVQIYNYTGDDPQQFQIE
ncbi:MAG: RICIN domain-containing protein [Oscillospiraceae bacterium]|nr:RICIN domain-containing protein [Oscillospiraceae bacterium]